MKNKDDKKKVLGTGEMEQSEIEKGGEWYQARLDLETICKEAGMDCKVYPFDQHQGPYAKLKNGGKLWIADYDVFFYEGPKGPIELDKEDMIDFLKSIAPFKPKIVHKSPTEKTPGVKWPRTRSKPEDRKHLQLIKSVLAELVNMKGLKTPKTIITLSVLKDLITSENTDKKYEYIIDLDERGTFSCHVDDPAGKEVWSASNEDNEDGEFSPVVDGFMKHTKDIQGLEKYLEEMGIMPKDAKLVKGN